MKCNNGGKVDTWDKRARLEELNLLLDGHIKHEPHEEGRLLHEALGLCEDLGLDRAWRRFKALLERLQQDQLQQRKQELNEQDDWLLRYAIALDAGNFDLLGEILEMAKTVPGLEAAITGMHQRFDSNESWTQQLQAYRRELQGKETE
jgi:hypothetical protein